MTENLEDRNGLLYIEGTNDLADGTFTSLGEADVMYSEFSIKKGKRHGLSIVYWSNGNIAFKENFRLVSATETNFFITKMAKFNHRTK